MSRSIEKNGNQEILVEEGPKKISSVYFKNEEHEMWECDSLENAKQKNSDGRSKSQGNSTEREPSYTHSIKDVSFS